MICFITIFSTSEADLNGIFKQEYDKKTIDLFVSGSSKQYINGSKQVTKPEYAISPWNKRYDWCSNCGVKYDDHPWIGFSIKSKKIRFNSYFIRCGCCYEAVSYTHLTLPTN